MKDHTEEPVVTPNTRGGTVTTHPAFGMIGVSRVQGGTTLFGSDFIHHNFMSIRIKRSELHRDLAHDWVFAKDEIVEVRLSEAQWATFVSSPNSGDGTPCTLAYVNKECMPDIPLRTQVDEFKKEVREDIAQAVGRVKSAISDIEGELGASLSKSKREAILTHLKSLQRDLSSSLPFVLNSAEKHMENTVEKAKVEVNAYMQGAIHRAGINALNQAGAAPLQLGAGIDSTEKSE